MSELSRKIAAGVILATGVLVFGTGIASAELGSQSTRPTSDQPFDDGPAGGAHQDGGCQFKDAAGAAAGLT
jgi:hypothetical protein